MPTIGLFRAMGPEIMPASRGAGIGSLVLPMILWFALAGVQEPPKEANPNSIEVDITEAVRRINSLWALMERCLSFQPMECLPSELIR